MSASVLDLTPQVATFSQYPYSNRSSWPGPALPQRSDPARGQRPGSARVRSVLRPLRRRRRVGCLSRSLQGGYAHTLNPRHRWMRIEREAPSGTLTNLTFTQPTRSYSPAMASKISNPRGALLCEAAHAARFKPIEVPKATRPSGDDSLFGKSSNLVSAQSKCVASDTLKSDGQCLPPGGAASLIQVNPSSNGASARPTFPPAPAL